MAGGWKPAKTRCRFPPVSTPLGNPANDAGFPHSHRAGGDCPQPSKKSKKRKEVGRCAGSKSGSISGSRCIGNVIEFQDHPRIGKCSLKDSARNSAETPGESPEVGPRP